MPLLLTDQARRQQAAPLSQGVRGPSGPVVVVVTWRDRHVLTAAAELAWRRGVPLHVVTRARQPRMFGVRDLAGLVRPVVGDAIDQQVCGIAASGVHVEVHRTVRGTRRLADAIAGTVGGEVVP